MKIESTYNWMRRDFLYTEVCENCGHENINCRGYDDFNYYNNIQPNRKCSVCGISTVEYEALNPKTSVDREQTRYPKNLVM